LKAQLHAGYILDSVKKALLKLDSPIDISSLLSQLSCFKIEYNFDIVSIEDSIVTVLDNLLSRGLPTFPSIFIEDIFSEKFEITEKELNNKTGEILYNERDRLTENINLIYNSFFIVDPRINRNNKPSFDFNTWEDHSGSEYEESFFDEILPNKFSEAFRQLIEP